MVSCKPHMSITSLIVLTLLWSFYLHRRFYKLHGLFLTSPITNLSIFSEAIRSSYGLRLIQEAVCEIRTR